MFHGMRGEVWLLAEELGNVTASLSGGAEKGWAGCPAHLECCWNHKQGLWVGDKGWIVGIQDGWQDAAELMFVGFWDTHAPETVLNVQFAEQQRAGRRISSGKLIDESAQNLAELVHGFTRGSGFVGELIDGLGLGATLTFGRQIQDHAEKPALVWDGGNGADFGVLMETFLDEFAQLAPGNNLAKTLFNFFEGFIAAGFGSLWVFSGGMRTIGDGSIQLFQGPIFHNFHWTPCGAKSAKHGSCWVPLGQTTREHEATGGDLAVGLTLGVCEDVEEFLGVQWSNGLTCSVKVLCWGTVPSWVVCWRHGMQSPWWRGGSRGQPMGRWLMHHQLLSFGVLVGQVLHCTVKVMGRSQLTSGGPGGAHGAGCDGEMSSCGAR